MKWKKKEHDTVILCTDAAASGAGAAGGADLRRVRQLPTAAGVRVDRTLPVRIIMCNVYPPPCTA
mgnify:CR=1 FL=1